MREPYVPVGLGLSLVLLILGLGLPGCGSPTETIAPKAEVRPVFEMVRLEYAVAHDAAGILRQQLQAAEVEISVDERTNSLLLTGSREGVARAKEQIAALDVEVE